MRFLLFVLIIYLRQPNHPSRLSQAAVKFFVEIAAPGLEEEVLEDVEVDLFGGGFVGEIAEDVFHGIQEVVPVVDKFLVTRKFRGVEPFFQFHFGFWLFLALAGLKKIPEAATFVVASHGEEATDAGTDAVSAKYSGIHLPHNTGQAETAGRFPDGADECCSGLPYLKRCRLLRRLPPEGWGESRHPPR